MTTKNTKAVISVSELLEVLPQAPAPARTLKGLSFGDSSETCWIVKPNLNKGIEGVSVDIPEGHCWAKTAQHVVSLDTRDLPDITIPILVQSLHDAQIKTFHGTYSLAMLCQHGARSITEQLGTNPIDTDVAGNIKTGATPKMLSFEGSTRAKLFAHSYGVQTPAMLLASYATTLEELQKVQKAAQLEKELALFRDIILSIPGISKAQKDLVKSATNDELHALVTPLFLSTKLGDCSQRERLAAHTWVELAPLMPMASADDSLI